MAVKVKRERPDQRRHHRVTAPLYVSYAGERVKAADWSLGGLRVTDFAGTLPKVGSEIDLQLTLPFQGFDVTFDVKAEIVRQDQAAGTFAARFTAIGERERELMSHFLEELVRGSMSEVQDTIQRIDVPVTPASLQPDVNPIKRLPVRRWPARALAMSAIYGVLGLVIFSYTGLLTYSNFYRMEVQTAVITAPVETVTAQTDGRIKWTDIKPGDHVKAGTVIVQLVDSQLEKELELAEIEVRERKAKLGALKRRHIDELERAKGYATVEMKNIRQTKLELQALVAQLELAERSHGRIKTLHAKGFATDAKLDEAQNQVITLRKELEVRRIELATRIELSEQNFGKRMYTGNPTIGTADLIGKVGEVEADIRLAEHEVELSRQRYNSYVNHRDRQAVRSPFDGMVLELPRVDDGNVRRGDTIAIIEQRERRQVTAYLNQEEVMRVGLGDEASLFVPALGVTLKARVARIDRTSGFVQEQGRAQGPGYRWRGPVDRSAKVILEFVDQAQVRDADRYRSGLPVVVVFPQRSTNSLLASLRQRLSQAF